MSFRTRSFARISLLGCFFLALYEVCNLITSKRPDVGFFYFEWERQIPFVPWMIIPYLSMYPLFIVSALFIKNESELDATTKRIIFTVVISVTCFLLFPLRFAFERPQVEGFFKPFFIFQDAVDEPYNLAPALHISLLLIMLDVYYKRTIRFACFGVNAWFLIIALSTVLTYQHHLTDVAGGIIVGMASLYLFRPRRI